MNIDMLVVGKTNIDYIISGIEIYSKRINQYNKFNIITIPDIKNAKSLTIELQKNAEAEVISKFLDKYDYIILLDEKGKEFSSVDFSKWLNKINNQSYKNVCFLIGGAYGFSESIYSKASEKISISKMTFSHQMIRLLFTEQLYRAYTILNNEPYHHQ